MTIDSGQNQKVHRGEFFAWFETGLEGLVWALQSEDDASIEGLVVLEASDWVEICSPSGEVLFAGEIAPDFNVGRAPFASAAERNQPKALGFWIHWTQAGFTPEEWAGFFLPGNVNVGSVKKADDA